MSDIVERLREEAALKGSAWRRRDGGLEQARNALLVTAADEIERLRAEVARLRDAVLQSKYRTTGWRDVVSAALTPRDPS